MTRLLRANTDPWAEFFAFDLEMVGASDEPSKCRIWDIAVMHMVTQTSFCATVDPGLEEYVTPPHEELFHVTQQYLDEHKARPFSEVCRDLVSFVESFCTPCTPSVALVAHGVFLLDKPVLENEFRRAGRQVPPNWYFYDTLPFFRRKYRRLPSYSLKNLYQKVFHNSPTNHHMAKGDVVALHTLLLEATGGKLSALDGCYCPAYLHALQEVKFVGTQKEQLLFAAGITCVEDLIVTLAKTCTLNLDHMAHFLQTHCCIERTSALKVARSVLHIVLRQTKNT